MSTTQKTPTANRKPEIAACLLILALALAQRRLVMANSDVAWLLTVAEKWLQGRELYVDVLETNPPFAVWLYAPVVLLGRLAGVRPEAALDAVIMTLAAASVWIAHRLLAHRAPAGLAAATLAILTVLPAACFGEREHVALIFFLPVLALTVRRAEGAETAVATAALAGAAAAVVLCIKPHFAVAIALPAFAAAALRRSWRPVFGPEHLIAGALFCAYVASIFWLHPAFWTQMMPLVRLLYLPARIPVAQMLSGGLPLLVVEFALVAVLLRPQSARSLCAPLILAPSAAIAGFLIAAIIQGKGWPYHFYPGLALTEIWLAGVGVAAVGQGPALQRRAIVALGCAGLFSVQFWLWFDNSVDMRVIHAPLRALQANPRMIAIASDFAVAFPAVRAVDGVWVGRSFSRWVPYHAAGLAARADFDATQLPAFREAEETDRRQLAQDIIAGKPDVIVVERQPHDFLAWAEKDRELAALMRCFRAAGRYWSGAPDSGAGFEVELYAADGRAPASAGCPR